MTRTHGVSLHMYIDVYIIFVRHIKFRSPKHFLVLPKCKVYIKIEYIKSYI